MSNRNLIESRKRTISVINLDDLTPDSRTDVLHLFDMRLKDVCHYFLCGNNINIACKLLSKSGIKQNYHQKVEIEKSVSDPTLVKIQLFAFMVKNKKKPGVINKVILGIAAYIDAYEQYKAEIAYGSEVEDYDQITFI